MTTIGCTARISLVLATALVGFLTLNHLASGSTSNPTNSTTITNNEASMVRDRVDQFDLPTGDANFSLVVAFTAPGWCSATMSNDCSTTGAGPDGPYSPTGGAIPVGGRTGNLTSSVRLSLSSVGSTFLNGTCDQLFAVSFVFYAGKTTTGTDVTVIDGKLDVNSSGGVDGSDDSTNISGRTIVNGSVDTNGVNGLGDGAITAADDGVIEHDLRVIDGGIDLNGDAAVNGSDDGSINEGVVSPDPIAIPADPLQILANDPDGNGLQNHVDHYPDYLLDILEPDGPGGAPPLTPRLRSTGDTVVADTTVILQFVAFGKGDLTALGGPPYNTMTAAKGFPSFTVLQDPTAEPPGKSQISDFCTPVSATTTNLGTTVDNPLTGANEGGKILGRNAPGLDVLPPVGIDSSSGGVGNTGTHLVRLIERSQRDQDGDGLENAFDTCPYDPDTVNPRTSNGPDGDALNDSCDPDDVTMCTALNQAPCDQDADGWHNRLDVCPQVADGDAAPPETRQLDADLDPWVEPADGGSRDDDIGDACDLSDTTPDGHVHFTENKTGVCNGAAEPEDNDTTVPDGWCNARETYLGTSTTDGCADTAAENDEATDKSPPDFNDDQQVTITDRTLMSLAIKSAAFEVRFDLDAGGTNNVTDRTILVSFIGVGVPDAGGVKKCQP